MRTKQSPYAHRCTHHYCETDSKEGMADMPGATGVAILNEMDFEQSPGGRLGASPPKGDVTERGIGSARALQPESTRRQIVSGTD